jgi:PilZ domain
MLQGVFILWRHLTGEAPEAQAVSVQDDRRLWGRHATDLQGNVHVAKNAARDKGEKILACVRDLSCAGANLLLDRPLAPGQMLSLELPAANDEVRTVLAYVVRCIPQRDDPTYTWSLGCLFARELSITDLNCLGAPKVPASDDDKRVWVRYDCVRCPVKANYRKVSDPAGESQPVQVLDISAAGIGLSVCSPLDAGSLLTLDLLDKSGQRALTMLACVVHTTSRVGGEYAVGCNFIRELSEEELQSLL